MPPAPDAPVDAVARELLRDQGVRHDPVLRGRGPWIKRWSARVRAGATHPRCGDPHLGAERRSLHPLGPDPRHGQRGAPRRGARAGPARGGPRGRRARRARLAASRPWSARSPTARACGAALAGVDASSTPRRCTSRTSARTAGRRSSRRTSPARSPCSRRRSRPASAASSSRARRARSAARSPPAGAPAAWITEDVAPVPRNIYGARRRPPRTCASSSTETTACRAWSCARRASSPRPTTATTCARAYEDANVKVNELLYRRVDIEDVVERAPAARSSARPRSASAATSSARRRRSPAGPGRPARRRAGRRAPAVPRLRGGLRARAAGRCSRASSASTSTPARAPSSAGAAYDFRHALDRCGPARTRAARSRAAVGAKGYHAVSTGPYTAR